MRNNTEIQALAALSREVLDWLLAGDVAIQYQVHRDLLGQEKPELQARIATEGWGNRFLDARRPNGYWGQSYYQPKWISTHYSLLDLRLLNLDQSYPEIQSAIDQLLDPERGLGRKQFLANTHLRKDVCVNGMLLNVAAYFQTEEYKMEPLVDFILSQQMSDGGFNCMKIRSGATHSSMHSTLSTLEGLSEFLLQGYHYRKTEIKEQIKAAQEFLLRHQLYLSDRTGEVIKKDFLRFSFPGRWKYDIMRALDYFQHIDFFYDPRMRAAIHEIRIRQTRDGYWRMRAKYPGKIHFEMEQAGRISRWNTLRALRILKQYA